MRVRLSLPVVEEMTSLSRIIRNIQAQTTEEKEIKIQPSSYFQPQNPEALEQVEREVPLTREQILLERHELLEEARWQINLERAQLEQLKQEQFEEIEQLKQLWEEEKPALQQQAYDEGFAQGYEEGVQKANADMEQAIKQANDTMTNAIANAQAYIEAQESVILELALTAAERIIETELARDEENFVAIVKKGLKEAREMKEIKVYVAPEYHHVVTQNRDELAEMFPEDVPFMIFVNEDLSGAESYIETNHGRIVVSMDTQLNELRIKLREILDSKE